jgi:DNA polymerase III alpha subunit
MQIDNYGRTILNPNEAFDALYSGKIANMADLYLDDKNLVNQYNRAIYENADKIPELHTIDSTPFDNVKLFDKSNQCDWFMPKEYRDFEIVGFLLDQTQNEEQYQRVVTELELFIQHNMIDLLKYLKYLVDAMRENKIVWGVGRGSSVASYCLYLLGVHKIDSIKYNLDIKEFLK